MRGWRGGRTVRRVNEEALRRINAEIGDGTIDAVAGLSGADITTFMLEIARRRADGVDAAEVLRRYRSDRFSQPAGFDPEALDRAERILVGALPAGFDTIVLAPVVPLGSHRLAGVDQSRVVSTVRANEVAADPTNGLALEAAVRRAALLRSDARSVDVVRLAASQRVLRAQRFEGRGDVLTLPAVRTRVRGPRHRGSAVRTRGVRGAHRLRVRRPPAARRLRDRGGVDRSHRRRDGAGRGQACATSSAGSAARP